MLHPAHADGAQASVEVVNETLIRLARVEETALYAKKQ
jgi:hypothetical protein